jgi:hypothetical protein
MKTAKLAWLKFFAWLLLLPGLAGLIVSAIISTHDLDTMPRVPALEQHRIIPFGIHGTTVYQTPAENKQFNLVESSSVGVFVVGFALGLVYLEKRGGLQTLEEFEDSALAQQPG